MGWQNGDRKKNNKKKNQELTIVTWHLFEELSQKSVAASFFLSKIIETQFHLNFHSENTIKYKFPPF